MPIDINQLRPDRGGDPDKVRASQRARFADETIVDKIMELDGQRRTAKYTLDNLRKEKGDVSKAAAAKKKADKKADISEEQAKSKALDEAIKAQDQATKDIDAKTENMLGKIGNIVHTDVIISQDEANNKVMRTWGTPSTIVADGSECGKLRHHEIMQCLGILEMERGSRVAGHRGYYLKGLGVMLNQALQQYGLTMLHKNDYTQVQPPYFMKKSIMEQTCQLSDFSENLYQVEGTDDAEPLYLIATSEQPISAMHMKEWIEPSDLPKRYAGVSTCFRKEAGSHGRDVWGIFRVHQFEKVEQFIYCDPSESWNELDRMIKTSELFYQGLGLPYQVINIVSGELNDAAAMKYDLEAWFPGYEAFRELVSCSNCTDYQSRALETRYALKNTDDKMYVHMLNGTMCATTRTMCCILENYQTAEGVTVPEALRPFMGGIDFIPYDEKCKTTFFKAKAEEEKREAERAKKGGNKGGKQKGGAAAAKPAQAKEESKKPAAAAKKQAAEPAQAAVVAPPAPKFTVNPRHDSLEIQLANYQWLGGTKQCAADAQAYEEIKSTPPRAESHPATFAWYAMVGKFTDTVRASWKGEAVVPAPVFKSKDAAKGNSAAAETADDEFDPFAEDPEADAAAAEAMKKKGEEAKAKKKKAAPIAKSLIIWEVKPWGEETDLQALADKILGIQMDGLYWKTEWKKEPVAYGVFKIVIGATVQDDKVSTDLVQEKIEEFEDDVQSVDIVAFNKL